MEDTKITTEPPTPEQLEEASSIGLTQEEQ
jgi:hypothetical protein